MAKKKKWLPIKTYGKGKLQKVQRSRLMWFLIAVLLFVALLLDKYRFMFIIIVALAIIARGFFDIKNETL